MNEQPMTPLAKTGRRAQVRTVLVWTADLINGIYRRDPALADQKDKLFRTRSQAAYALHEKSGAFVRIDKDRRSPKQRKAAKRLERVAATTSL